MEEGLGHINDYKLVKTLGRGAFATVFLATDFNQKQYAVKMVSTGQIGL